MPDNYKHLLIEKELLRNNRRTRKMNLPRIGRDDILEHSQFLLDNLAQARQNAQLQTSGSPETYVLKLNYSGHLDFAHLYKHGVNFISHEGQHVCVAFASEQGLVTFSEHITMLGLEDDDLTYKQILEALDGVDNWSVEDRMSWAVKYHGLPNTVTFTLDIELWPLEVTYHPERNQLCQNFENWLQEQQIRQIDKINLDSLLMYRVEVSTEKAELLLNCRDVRMVDLTPRAGISYQQLNRNIDNIPQNIPSPELNASKVCILDSGINTNHPLLKSSIAESVSFITDQDAFDHAGHGTAVSGIALYGKLEECNAANYWQPQLWIYNGKILDNDANFDEKTIERRLNDAVKYFVEQGCRIFNLSLGNANAPYDGKHIRGIAYLLDSLARYYDILFIVSAGNFSGSENPAVPENSWRNEYPEYLLSKESIIIDPAPALNILTVGSIAQHNATVDEQRYPEIYQLSAASENQPSPFTRHGPTVKGALKPELVATGGNLANPMREENRQWQVEMRGLGVLTCHNQFIGNTLFKEVSGTSFAAPYITHLAGRLLNEYPTASANFLRAMLVNHADIPREMETTFSEDVKTGYKEARETKHREIERDVAGYGVINENALYRSNENEVVLIADESIENNSHQFYELPLPSIYLRAQLATRELRITLSYLPAVRTTRLDYIATKISYRLVKGQSLEEVQSHFNHDTQKETETRNDDATGNRNITASLRDKGTVQSSAWKFRRRNPDEKWFVVITRQDRDWGEVLSLEKEEYALVVTVTDRDNEEAQLYSQIKERIQEQERIRNRI